MTEREVFVIIPVIILIASNATLFQWSFRAGTLDTVKVIWFSVCMATSLSIFISSLLSLS